MSRTLSVCYSPFGARDTARAPRTLRQAPPPRRSARDRRATSATTTSMMLRMIGLGPKKAKKKKSRRATLGAVPEYQKESRKPPNKGRPHALGGHPEHREVPKARKVRRSMRRHSLGAMPLSPDEKTPPRKRSLKKSASKMGAVRARQGPLAAAEMSPPPPGTPAEVRRLRKRVSELEQTIAFRDKSLDDIEAELFAAYASLLAAADLGFETSKYEARVEELSTAATEHPERALRDQELRKVFVDEEVADRRRRRWRWSAGSCRPASSGGSVCGAVGRCWAAGESRS